MLLRKGDTLLDEAREVRAGGGGEEKGRDVRIVHVWSKGPGKCCQARAMPCLPSDSAREVRAEEVG